MGLRVVALQKEMQQVGTASAQVFPTPLIQYLAFRKVPLTRARVSKGRAASACFATAGGTE